MSRVRIATGEFDVASRFEVTAGCDVDGFFVVICVLDFTTSTVELESS